MFGLFHLLIFFQLSNSLQVYFQQVFCRMKKKKQRIVKNMNYAFSYKNGKSKKKTSIYLCEPLCPLC